MVFRTAGVTWLALMMQAERARAGATPDTEWLLDGPTDPDVVEDDGGALLLAAE
ncbi:MAG: hypothetical protein H7236_14575 [Gemmatimonadaceae bacterium]|nr:hypothetical protein [Caulobacter sp.]